MFIIFNILFYYGKYKGLIIYEFLLYLYLYNIWRIYYVTFIITSLIYKYGACYKY